MGRKVISDVVFSPLSIIEVKGGDVLHVIKVLDTGFNSFGEAYFSSIKKGLDKSLEKTS